MSQEWAGREIQMRETQSLIPYERNPRLHPDSQIEKLKNSIRQWGWTMPILIDENDQVLAGHGRLHAGLELGVEEVPCIIASNWSEEQKKSYIVADNELAEGSEWNFKLKYDLLEELQTSGFDITLTGAEVDLDALSYTPEYNPIINTKELSESDMEKASEKMDKRLEESVKHLPENEVMCPNCGYEFTYSGQ